MAFTSGKDFATEFPNAAADPAARGFLSTNRPAAARRSPLIRDAVPVRRTPAMPVASEATPRVDMTVRLADRTPSARLTPREGRRPRHTGFATLQKVDPVLTRHKFSGIKVYSMAAVGAVFAAYIFNVQGTATFLDSFVSGFNSNLQSHSTSAVRLTLDFLPCLGLGIAALIVFAAGSALVRSIRTAQKTLRLNQRPCVTVDHFAHLTAAHGISHKVAREAYKLLLPIYANRFCARLNDELGLDLQLRGVAITDLYANLLLQTDRIAANREFQNIQIVTVLDLLLSVESAPHRSLHRAAAIDLCSTTA